jgi:hypothetical protein
MACMCSRLRGLSWSTLRLSTPYSKLRTIAKDCISSWDFRVGSGTYKKSSFGGMYSQTHNDIEGWERPVDRWTSISLLMNSKGLVNCSTATWSRCAPRKSGLDQPPFSPVDAVPSNTHQVKECQYTSADYLYRKESLSAVTSHASGSGCKDRP